MDEKKKTDVKKANDQKILEAAKKVMVAHDATLRKLAK